MSATTVEQEEAKRLSCMEIWGGNEAVDSALSVPGIDAWVFSEPYGKEASGGDIHYASMCGHGAISRFTIADVAGHGQVVGEVATDLRKLMRKHINRLDQSRFARSINGEFAKLSQEGTFATALLTTYFAPTDHLLVCNAGHPPPLWYRASQGKWQPLKEDDPANIERLSNLPLGIIEPTEYCQFAVKLELNDLVLLYTDSLIEAINSRQEQLGEEGLIEIAKTIDTNNPHDFGKRLLESLAAYRDNQPADDDVTFILLHHNAVNPPEQSFGEKLVIIGKMLGLVKV